MPFVLGYKTHGIAKTPLQKPKTLGALYLRNILLLDSIIILFHLNLIMPLFSAVILKLCLGARDREGEMLPIQCCACHAYFSRTVNSRSR